MRYLQIYQSSSTQCALTGKHIETMEPHIRLFNTKIPVKISNEMSVYENIKKKLENLDSLNDTDSSILNLHKTDVSCNRCDYESNKNIMFYTDDNAEEWLMKSLCLDCLNEICSELEEKGSYHYEACVYYNSAGVSVHNYPEERLISNVLESGESRAKSIISIGRNDVGKNIGGFPITDVEKLNKIIQSGRKSRYIKKSYKDYSCDTCTKKEGPNYKIGKNPDRKWNCIILCEDCLTKIRRTFEEIVEMDELMAFVI